VGVPRIGLVASYDADRGLGTVVDENLADDASVPLSRAHSFHCTAIADGSRAIAAGTPVAFVLVAGLGGVLEARSVTPFARSGAMPGSPAGEHSCAGVRSRWAGSRRRRRGRR
jgi:hypothetical protein